MAMMTLTIMAIISFVSTNIDDIFVVMLFFAQVNGKLKNHHVIIGQYLGIGILVGLSVLGAFGLQSVPQKYIGLLGLIPIALGIKAWVDFKRNKADSDQEESVGSKSFRFGIISVALVTLSNGADNVGVYIPLFSAYSLDQLLWVFCIYAIMTALWCFLGYRIANFPKIKAVIQKYKNYIITIVFIGLGIFILLESYF